MHLLAALLDQEGGLIPPLLERSGVNLSLLRQRLDAAINRLPTVRGADTFFGRDLKDMLDEALAEAERLKDEYVSTGAFPPCDDRPASDPEWIHTQGGRPQARGVGASAQRCPRDPVRVTDQDPEGKYQALEKRHD